MVAHEIEVLPDAEAVARRAAAVIAERARAAVASQGRFALAVSGALSTAQAYVSNGILPKHSKMVAAHSLTGFLR